MLVALVWLGCLLEAVGFCFGGASWCGGWSSFKAWLRRCFSAFGGGVEASVTFRPLQFLFLLVLSGLSLLVADVGPLPDGLGVSLLCLFVLLFVGLLSSLVSLPDRRC